LRIEGTVGFEELNVAAPAAQALAAMGWDTTHPAARDMAPTAARGNNLVAVVPPSPAYAAPALAGALGRIEPAAPFLVLVPASELDAWGALVHRLARELPLRVQVAHGESRALRRLRDGSLDLLVADPGTALSLLRRSALKADRVGGVLIAGPERFESADSLTELMHEVPKEAQRIVVTSDAARTADLIERYARKALTVTMPGAATAPDEVAASRTVRTAFVPWGRRVEAVAELIEVLDPATVAIWAADRSYEEEIGRAVPFGEGSVVFATGDAPPADLVIAFDLPDRARLAQLRAAGNVLLVAPPGTEPYVAGLAPKAPIVRLSGIVDQAEGEAARRRSAIRGRLEGGVPERAMLTLAPLFERHDPSAVAAALYDLWMEKGPAADAALSPGRADRSDRAAATGAGGADAATARIWAGIGKNDGVTPADFVGTMTKELRVDRASIGRIELKDSYSLIEVPAADAERIAGALNGITIRRKRVVARPDRGPSAPRDRRPPRTR
jgi:ATP-dependent RNA helicase DeaD